MYIKYDNNGNILKASGMELTGENTKEITENDIVLNSTIEFSKTNYYFDIATQKVKARSIEQKQAIENKKTINTLLNKFKPLIDAMTFQEIARQKGSNINNIIFSDTEIKNWGNYIGELVNGNLSASMPEIPIKYKELI